MDAGARSSQGLTERTRRPAQASRPRRIAGALAAATASAGLALAPAAASGPAAAAPRVAASTSAVANGDFLVTVGGDLYLLAPNGRNPRLVTRTGVEGVDGRFSPDGRRIVFSHSGSLFLINADGTRLRTLKPAGAATYSRPSFSRDGSKVAYRWSSPQHGGIAFMDARPGAAETVTIHEGLAAPYCEEGGAWPDGNYFEAVWSPIADNLAVLQDCFADPAQSEKVWILGPLGKRIASFEGWSDKYRLDFSPDGRKILYTSEDRDTNTELRVIDRPTGTTRVMTEWESHPSGAAWSPDGARIVTWMDAEWPGGELVTLRATDGGDVRVVPRPAFMTYGRVLDWRAAR